MAGVLISNLEYFAQAESKPNKRPNSLSDKVGNSRGFWSPSLSFCRSPRVFPFPFPVQQKHLLAQLFGPLFECCYGICRVAFIIWLAQKALWAPTPTANPTAASQPGSHLARNELCIDFLFAILTALTLFPSGGGGGSRRGHTSTETNEINARSGDKLFLKTATKKRAS